MALLFLSVYHTTKPKVGKAGLKDRLALYVDLNKPLYKMFTVS